MVRSTQQALPRAISFQSRLCSSLAREDGPTLDILALGVVSAGVLRSWSVLDPKDLAFLVTVAVASIATLLWRRCRPASYARYRELPAVFLRVAAAASPAAWKVTAQALNGTPPYGSSWPLNAAAFGLAVLFSSFAATGSVMALARPVRLWLHVPAQAAAMLLIAHRNPDICSTAMFQHPAARKATAETYAALSSLLHLAASPMDTLSLQHGPQGRCCAVLGLAEVLGGFLAPTLVLAVTESRLFAAYHHSWKEQEQSERHGLATGASGAAAHPPSSVLQTPSRLAVHCYQDLLRWRPLEPADWTVAAATAVMLLASTWGLLLLGNTGVAGPGHQSPRRRLNMVPTFTAHARHSRPPGSWPQFLREAQCRDDGKMLDVLALAVIAASLLRAWPLLQAADLAFLAACAAFCAASLLWRRSCPASYARYRELPAVILRVAAAASPAAWKVTAQALNGTPPYSSSWPLNAAAFGLAVLFSSFAATGSVMALARPVRLWLHVPAQAAAMLLIAHRNPDICSTAMFQHPAAQQATAGTYAALSSLLHLTAAPMHTLSLQHGPQGRCCAVLGVVQLLGGFLAPTLVLAAAESRLFAAYDKRWQEQQRCHHGEPQWQDSSVHAPAAAPGTSRAVTWLYNNCRLGWSAKEVEERVLFCGSHAVLLLAAAWQAMGGLLSVEDKSNQEGAVSQVNLYKWQLASLGLGTTRVEVRLSARGLPSKDVTSKSDPMAVLFTSAATGQTVWSELGRTNVVANCASPEWVRPVLAKSSGADGGPQPMRVVVYDADRRAKSPDSLTLTSQHYIGEAEFLMADLMTAPGLTLELPLLDLASGRQLPGCSVVLKAEELASQDNRVVRMAFSATGLAKEDVVSKSDPFLAAWKRRPAGGEADWVPVFKTETRMNNSDPLWQPIEVDIRQLCSADEKLPIKLQVWDHDSNGKHDLIGEALTSLAALKELAAAPATQRTILLTAPPGSKAAKTGTRVGSLSVRQVVNLTSRLDRSDANLTIFLERTEKAHARMAEDIKSEFDDVKGKLKSLIDWRANLVGAGALLVIIGAVYTAFEAFGCFLGMRMSAKCSKSDPMAVLFTSAATGQTVWSELGRTNVVANCVTGGEADWVPVFKTETRMNNSDPLWQPIEVDIRQLCSADEKLPIKLQVWDHDSNGKHDLIGEALTSLAALKELAVAPATQRTIPLMAPPGSKAAKTGTKVGSLSVRQVVVREGPTPTQQLFACCSAGGQQ
ncbi:Copine-5 [Chlorella vulgaris]